ncbi:putative quinol monooxygenase [Amycolatopsis pithecellobii]|uniref:ABM domain-containing protein n=1 Tax=Amycolatopsis pithecellobii TaxID=664692 RepID=A0A6N7ZC69_9PSEU|nr:putative quinol monooxygenase [Amycolatopsis pithecellobii]MTD59382.1 hypothetical protein [Amycolatopsis pithecellobii]
MINVIAALSVREGQTAAFESAVAKARPEMLADRGCLRYDLQRSSERESDYVLLEAYDSSEAIRRHRELRAYREFGEVVGSLLTAEPVIWVLEPVGDQCEPM